MKIIQCVHSPLLFLEYKKYVNVLKSQQTIPIYSFLIACHDICSGKTQNDKNVVAKYHSRTMALYYVKYLCTLLRLQHKNVDTEW